MSRKESKRNGWFSDSWHRQDQSTQCWLCLEQKVGWLRSRPTQTICNCVNDPFEANAHSGRWHFFQAFPSLASFSFHSNQEESISFHSPSMLLKTQVDQLWHLTVSRWQADILSSWVKICVCFCWQGFTDKVSDLFQICFNTPERWGFLKSVIPVFKDVQH